MSVCLVLGSAQCLWADVDRALDLGEFKGVVAAKRAGVLWPGRLDAWVTLHPERVSKDIAERKSLGHPAAARVYCHEEVGAFPGITHRTHFRFKGQNTTGSSGLFAVKVAFELGYTRAVLCGIPLQSSEGRIGFGPFWVGSRHFQKGFIEALPHLKDRVRSMSGWTSEKLGMPTAAWIEQGS